MKLYIQKKVYWVYFVFPSGGNDKCLNLILFESHCLCVLDVLYSFFFSVQAEWPSQVIGNNTIIVLLPFLFFVRHTKLNFKLLEWFYVCRSKTFKKDIFFYRWLYRVMKIEDKKHCKQCLPNPEVDNIILQF